MKRRSALTLLAAAAWRGADAQGLPAQPDLLALLRAGACAVLLRHTATEPGIGDPTGFQLGDCRTQRNLSEAGRAQARRIADWFARHALAPSAVQSSAWCRCRDTAELALGRHMVLPALNSTFDDGRRQDAQTLALRPLLRAIPAGQFEVWVTHQVNITTLTGAWAGNGEAFIVASDGRLLARSMALVA